MKQNNYVGTPMKPDAMTRMEKIKAIIQPPAEYDYILVSTCDNRESLQTSFFTNKDDLITAVVEFLEFSEFGKEWAYQGSFNEPYVLGLIGTDEFTEDLYDNGGESAFQITKVKRK